MLAGIPKADVLLAVQSYGQRGQRQQIVLNAMAETGFITEAEADKAASAKLALQDRQENKIIASYFRDYVRGSSPSS